MCLLKLPAPKHPGQGQGQGQGKDYSLRGMATRPDGWQDVSDIESDLVIGDLDETDSDYTIRGELTELSSCVLRKSGRILLAEGSFESHLCRAGRFRNRPPSCVRAVRTNSLCVRYCHICSER
jgi:hypothetical protein